LHHDTVWCLFNPTGGAGRGRQKNDEIFGPTAMRRVPHREHRSLCISTPTARLQTLPTAARADRCTHGAPRLRALPVACFRCSTIAAATLCCSSSVPEIAFTPHLHLRLSQLNAPQRLALLFSYSSLSRQSPRPSLPPDRPAPACTAASVDCRKSARCQPIQRNGHSRPYTLAHPCTRILRNTARTPLERMLSSTLLHPNHRCF
jgi:hypothetical protein